MAITNGNFVQNRKSSAINLIFHLEEKIELNESIEVVAANRFNVEAMFQTAQKRGLKNAVFHMQFSPALNQSSQKYDLFEDLLKDEYSLEDGDFYAVEHGKQRELTDSGLGADTHRHYVFSTHSRETGKNRDFSFYKIRNEKLSRKFELIAGEPLTPGRFDEQVYDAILNDESFVEKYKDHIIARADDIRNAMERTEKPTSSYDTTARIKAEEAGLSLPKLRNEMKGMSQQEAAQHFKFLAEAYGLSVQIGKDPNRLDDDKSSRRKGKQGNLAYLVDGNGAIILNMSRISKHRLKGTEWAEMLSDVSLENFVAEDFDDTISADTQNKIDRKAAERARKRADVLSRLNVIVEDNKDITHDRPTTTESDFEFGQHAPTDERSISNEVDNASPRPVGANGSERGRGGAEPSRPNRRDARTASADGNISGGSGQGSASGGDHDERSLRPAPRGGVNVSTLGYNTNRNLDHVIGNLFAGAIITLIGLAAKAIAPQSALASSIIDQGLHGMIGYRAPTDKQIMANLHRLDTKSLNKPRVQKLRALAQKQRRANAFSKADDGMQRWLNDQWRVVDRLGLHDDDLRRDTTLKSRVQEIIKYERNYLKDLKDVYVKTSIFEAYKEAFDKGETPDETARRIKELTQSLKSDIRKFLKKQYPNLSTEEIADLVQQHIDDVSKRHEARELAAQRTVRNDRSKDFVFGHFAFEAKGNTPIRDMLTELGAKEKPDEYSYTQAVIGIKLMADQHPHIAAALNDIEANPVHTDGKYKGKPRKLHTGVFEVIDLAPKHEAFDGLSKDEVILLYLNDDPALFDFIEDEQIRDLIQQFKDEGLSNAEIIEELMRIDAITPEQVQEMHDKAKERYWRERKLLIKHGFIDPKNKDNKPALGFPKSLQKAQKKPTTHKYGKYFAKFKNKTYAEIHAFVYSQNEKRSREWAQKQGVKDVEQMTRMRQTKFAALEMQQIMNDPAFKCRQLITKPLHDFTGEDHNALKDEYRQKELHSALAQKGLLIKDDKHISQIASNAEHSALSKYNAFIAELKRAAEEKAKREEAQRLQLNPTAKNDHLPKLDMSQ